MIQRNPVYWLMWALPGAAVLAGFATLAIAMQSADRALPDIYHWEGDLLDADFERARQAVRLGLSADLVIEAGQCTVTLTPAPADTDRLQLHLVNGTDVRLDRAVELAPTQPGQYSAACAALPRGRWRVSMQDTGNTWYLRGQLDDAQTRVSLVARDPEGLGT